MVIDVKFGSGLYMREDDQAKALAHALVKTGNSCGIRTRALLTDMNQPLGQAVGNSIEVKECIELLRGEADARAQPVLDLELSAHMLVLSHVDNDIEAARTRLRNVVSSGAALECFRRNVEAQGGDPRVCDDPANILPLVTQSFRVESPRSGFITKVNAEIGHAIASIGEGVCVLTTQSTRQLVLLPMYVSAIESATTFHWERFIVPMKRRPRKRRPVFKPGTKLATNPLMSYRNLLRR